MNVDDDSASAMIPRPTGFTIARRGMPALVMSVTSLPTFHVRSSIVWVSVVVSISSCEGCTSPLACNFEPSASEDDGSCEFTSCACTYPSACNFDVTVHPGRRLLFGVGLRREFAPCPNRRLVGYPGATKSADPPRCCTNPNVSTSTTPQPYRTARAIGIRRVDVVRKHRSCCIAFMKADATTNDGRATWYRMPRSCTCATHRDVVNFDRGHCFRGRWLM